MLLARVLVADAGHGGTRGDRSEATSEPATPTDTDSGGDHRAMAESTDATGADAVPSPDLDEADDGPNDALDQARADLAGDPDPYGLVPDAGDFGLSAVDPVAAADGKASFSEDNYMDQPDIGSTGDGNA